MGPFPVLPIRDHVYFPGSMISVLVGRERSINAVNDAWEHGRMVVLVAQKSAETEDPDEADLYQFGVMAELMQVLRVPDGTVRVMADTSSRVRVAQYI